MGREPGEETARAQIHPQEGEREERQPGGNGLDAVPLEESFARSLRIPEPVTHQRCALPALSPGLSLPAHSDTG